MRPTRKALGVKTEASDSFVFRRTPLSEKLRDLKCLLILLWRQGIVGKTRVLFWRQLIGIYRANPSRLTQYLVSLYLGENLFQLRIRELSKFAMDRESRAGEGGGQFSISRSAREGPPLTALSHEILIRFPAGKLQTSVEADLCVCPLLGAHAGGCLKTRGKGGIVEHVPVSIVARLSPQDF